MILGLDIGGANTKAASSDGSYTESIYLPLWKGAPLEEALCSIARRQPLAEAVAVVITGELADCFSCKREGLESLMATVSGDTRWLRVRAPLVAVSADEHARLATAYQQWGINPDAD